MGHDDDEDEDEDRERVFPGARAPRRARVPPRRRIDFDDRGVDMDPGTSGGGRGIAAQEARPDEAPYRDERHGGDPTGGDDAYGQEYAGRMRSYRQTDEGTFRAEKAPQVRRAEGQEHRLDADIVDDVQALLRADLGEHGNGVETAARGGRVVLTGRVPSDETRARAEHLAGITAGVIAVDNQLRVDAD